MAALASSAVTVVRSWYEPATGVRLTTKQLTLVLTGQGGNTNTIDASTLGFTKMLTTSNAITSDDGFLHPAVISYDGSKLLLIDASKNEANTATRDVPTDLTGITIRVVVTGYTK